jgi:hypothetical protein
MAQELENTTVGVFVSNIARSSDSVPTTLLS